MKKERNELVEFLGGAAMLAAGLYMFSNKVMVTNSFFGGGMLHIGHFNMPSGACIIPLIIGIFMMFVMPDNWLGKLVTFLGAIIIIAAVIMSTQLHLRAVSLYEWIIYFVLIFGGLGLVLRVLLAKPKDSGTK